MSGTFANALRQKKGTFKFMSGTFAIEFMSGTSVRASKKLDQTKAQADVKDY